MAGLGLRKCTWAVVFSYRVPYQGSSFELDRMMVYAVTELNVLMPEGEVAMTSHDLFEDIPVPDNSAPAPKSETARSPFLGYGLLAGGGILLLASVGLVWRRRAGEEGAMESAFDSDDEAAGE